MIVKLLTEHHLKFLVLKCGCRGSSESTLVKSHIVGNLILHLLCQIWASTRENLSSEVCEQQRYTGVTNYRCTNCLRQAIKQTILEKPINYILLN